MIHTSLEATVEQDNWGKLKEAYTNVDKTTLPSGLLSSHLLQDQTEPNTWRIVTFWNSRRDLDEYRKSVETPAWILIFRAAGAEPKLSISEIIMSK